MDEVYCPYCMRPMGSSETVCPSCGEDFDSYHASSHHLPSGTILQGRYLVGRFLGEGGFGITYIGRDLTLQRRVAIKEYFPVASALRDATVSLDVVSRYGGKDESFSKGMERFLAEARTMARMDKQNAIVGVRDFFEENGTAYIVMEYVEGITLKKFAESRGGKVSSKELLPMLEPLFEALEGLHAAGLVHRDISPDNIMLENGSARLIDFGCAREGADGSETMTVILKYDYAPIEQYDKHGQGPWTDVYALCATLYRCLCGKTAPRAVDRIVHDRLVPPTSLGADLTPAQERAIMRGLALQPTMRTQSVKELREVLYGELGPSQGTAKSDDDGTGVARSPLQGLTVVAGQLDGYGYEHHDSQANSASSLYGATYVFEDIPCSNNDQLARELAGNWESARRHLYSRNLERHFFNNGDTDLSSKLFEIVTGDLATRENQDLGLAKAIWLISSNNPILVWKGADITLPTLAKKFSTAPINTLGVYDDVIASGILSWYLNTVGNADSQRASDVLCVIEEAARKKPAFARYLFLHVFASGGCSAWANSEGFEPHAKRFLSSPFAVYRMASAEDELDDALASFAPNAYEQNSFEEFVYGRLGISSQALAPTKVGQILALLDKIGKGSLTARSFALSFGPSAAWLWMARNASLYGRNDNMDHVFNLLVAEVPKVTDPVEAIMAHANNAKPLCDRVLKSMDNTPLPEYLGYDGGGTVKALHVDAIPCASFYGEKVPRGFVRSLLIASPETTNASWEQVSLLSGPCRKQARNQSGFGQLAAGMLEELDSSGESSAVSYGPVVFSGVVLLGVLFSLVNNDIYKFIVSHVKIALRLFGPPLKGTLKSGTLIGLVAFCIVVMFGTELVLSVLEIYSAKTGKKAAGRCADLVDAGNAEVIGFANGTSELAFNLNDRAWEGPIVSIDVVSKVRDALTNAAKWKKLKEQPWYAILWHVTSAIATILTAIVLVALAAETVRDLMIYYAENSTQAASSSTVKSAAEIASTKGIEGNLLPVMIGLFGIYALQVRGSIRKKARSAKSWLTLALSTFVIVCLIAGFANMIVLSAS